MTRADVARAALGALLFLAGAAVGWLSRGMSAPTSVAHVVDPDAARASVADRSAAASESVALGLGDAGARSEIAERDADEVPEGQGDVAVVGAGGDAADGADASGRTSEDEDAAGAGSGATEGSASAVHLDASSIRDVVGEHRSQLGFCFAWQLHQHPELAGRLTMEFVIDGEGQVLRSSVIDDQLGDDTVAECFAGVTRRMEFPPPEGGGEVTVRYPFELSPDGDPSLDGGVGR